MFKQFFGACNQLDWFVSEILISAKADCELSIEKKGVHCIIAHSKTALE